MGTSCMSLAPGNAGLTACQVLDRVFVVVLICVRSSIGTAGFMRLDAGSCTGDCIRVATLVPQRYGRERRSETVQIRDRILSSGEARHGCGACLTVRQESTGSLVLDVSASLLREAVPFLGMLPTGGWDGHTNQSVMGESGWKERSSGRSEKLCSFLLRSFLRLLLLSPVKDSRRSNEAFHKRKEPRNKLQ